MASISRGCRQSTKGKRGEGEAAGSAWQECQARIQETWALLPAPATHSLGILEQDHPEGRAGGAGTEPRSCLGEGDLAFSLVLGKI